jgi:hypothetical protein
LPSVDLRVNRRWRGVAYVRWAVRVLSSTSKESSMKLLAALLATALTALVLIAAGCGGSGEEGGEEAAADPNAPEVNEAGDIPDDQVFVEYEPASGNYVVKVPEGWGQTKNGDAVTFTDKLNSIRMESVRAAAAPTVESAKSDEVPQLESSVDGFELDDVTTVDRSAGKAVVIKYLATGEPDAVTGKSVTNAVERYEFFQDGNEVILTLSGPKGADNVDPWMIVSDSLRWK